ncbi:MAG: hypothetical protein WD512_15955 [Candidatus Paceibacterota bacterium]
MKIVVFTSIVENWQIVGPIDNPKMFEMVPGWDYGLLTNSNPSAFHRSGVKRFYYSNGIT